MDTTFNTSQKLLLWNLIASGGNAWLRDLRPEPRKALRDPLESAGLIRLEQRYQGDAGRQARHVYLTPDGWKWAEAHMGDALSEGNSRNTSTEILEKLLKSLQSHLSENEVELRQVFEEGAEHPELTLEKEKPPVPEPIHPPSGPPSAAPGPMVDTAILRAIREHERRRKAGPMRLSSLRSRFDLTEEEVEASLERLRSRGEVDVAPLGENDATSGNGERKVWRQKRKKRRTTQAS